MNYREFSDDELLSYIRDDNEEAYNLMYKKYEPLIFSTANRMIKSVRNAGLEVSDLVQEGRLGLAFAIKSYSEHKDASFYTYAKMCIERKIITCIVGTKRLKHKILNESVPMDFKVNNEEHSLLEYLFEDNLSNPENKLIAEEYEQELLSKTRDKLTDFELQVFELKLNDFSYKEIADILDKDKKMVDNAIQRIKAKLKNTMNETK